LSGEEEKFGMYGSHIISPEEELAPDEMLRALLSGKGVEAVSFGRRSAPLELFRRLRYNAAARRQSSALSNL
jgi:hypothetical protein